MQWDEAEKLTGAVEHSVAAAAFVAGGIWAFFRFARFRTLKPRLNFTFEWTRSDASQDRSLIILTIKLQNAGRTKVLLRTGSDLACFLKYALVRNGERATGLSLFNAPPRRLEHLDTIFAPHGWIEPGETIDDVKAMEVDRAGLLAIQIEASVFGKRKYSAPAAFSLVGSPIPSLSASEDEQDEYEEGELLVEGLGSVLARISRLDQDAKDRCVI